MSQTSQTSRQQRIAELKGQIAREESLESLEEIAVSLKGLAKNPDNQEAQDAFYKVAKSYCNSYEKARRATKSA